MQNPGSQGTHPILDHCLCRYDREDIGNNSWWKIGGTLEVHTLFATNQGRRNITVLVLLLRICDGCKRGYIVWLQWRLLICKLSNSPLLNKWPRPLNICERIPRSVFGFPFVPSAPKPVTLNIRRGWEYLLLHKTGLNITRWEHLLLYMNLPLE